MTTNELVSFEDVLSLVRAIDDFSICSDGTSAQFLEIKKIVGSEGIQINGNVGGLIHFARLVLEVAKKGFVGAHQHFDEAGEVDLCEAPVIVGFKPADWDSV